MVAAAVGASRAFQAARIELVHFAFRSSVGGDYSCGEGSRIARARGRWGGAGKVSASVLVRVKTCLAAEPGGVDLAAEGFAEVGGDLVAVVEHVGGEGEDGVGVEGDEVGVLAGFDGADVGGEAGEACGCGGGPVGELREREFAAEALGPENGDGGGERGDAAPGEVEAAGLFAGLRGLACASCAAGRGSGRWR